MITRRSLFLLITLAVFLSACAAPPQTPADSAADTPAPQALAPTPTPAAAAAQPATPKQWDQPPPMSIDPTKIYLATFKTQKGVIQVELFAAKAPTTVNNFVFLANQGYYDGTTFHRVLANFMAQGGDPTGAGSGGPGYSFEDEFDPGLRFDEPGLLAMANAGPNTNGSQFFITFVPTSHLSGLHTIFGKVVNGMDVAVALTLRDPQTDPAYPGDTLLTVEVEEIPQSLLPPPTATPVPIVPELAEGRPLAALEITARENLYTGMPEMVIDPTRAYTAAIATTKGEIVLELYPQDAPESVNNFVVLARLGYWDGFPVVFVDPGEFILTGTPRGRPDSDIGYTVPSELKRSNAAGAVGYWYRDDLLASSGSQFYIMLKDHPDLDARYTVFGVVVEGLDVVAALTVRDTIKTITVSEE